MGVRRPHLGEVVRMEAGSRRGIHRKDWGQWRERDREGLPESFGLMLGL